MLNAVGRFYLLLLGKGIKYLIPNEISKEFREYVSGWYIESVPSILDSLLIFEKSLANLKSKKNIILLLNNIPASNPSIPLTEVDNETLLCSVMGIFTEIPANGEMIKLLG